MEAFKTLKSIVIPIDRANVDTDAIIPKQFLKTIHRTGLGKSLFYDWRYLSDGVTPNPDFVINQTRYKGGRILLSRENFGSGSSREHAPWALLDFGIKAIIAPSFADIFYNNCFKNGILPIRIDRMIVDGLFKEIDRTPGYQAEINLESQLILLPDGRTIPFEIDSFLKKCLLEGLDDISLTFEKKALITSYEDRRRKEAPWLFPDMTA